MVKGRSIDIHHVNVNPGSDLRMRTCGLEWSSLILLGGINRDNSRSLILRSKASFVRWDSRIRSSSTEICFGDVAIPDSGISAHVLPDDQDKEGNIIEEH